MKGLALSVNRGAAGTIVLFPTILHRFTMTGPFGTIEPSGPVDVQLFKNGKPVPRAKTGPPTRDRVAHLDDVVGAKVAVHERFLAEHYPPDPKNPPDPQEINARVLLAGGTLWALPAVAHGGRMKDVIWTFPKSNHKQKLTDLVVFETDLDAVDALVVSGGFSAQLPMPRGEADAVDIHFENEDECPEGARADYALNEPQHLFDLLNLGPRTPIKGTASYAFRERPRHIDPAFVRPVPSVCDDICPWFQADA